MKVGDLVKFVGSWSPNNTLGSPTNGVVLELWFSHRSPIPSSADVLWNTGAEGNVLARYLRVVDENR